MESNIRPATMERITNACLAEQFIEAQVQQVRAQVGNKKVLLALSGGVFVRRGRIAHQGHRQAVDLCTRQPWIDA